MEGFKSQVIWWIKSGRRRSYQKLGMLSFSNGPHCGLPAPLASNPSEFGSPTPSPSVGGGGGRWWCRTGGRGDTGRCGERE